MSDSKNIPISKAKEISNQYNFDGVIIIGINNDRSGHITTYGKTKDLCKIIGNIAKGLIADLLFKKPDFINDIVSKTYCQDPSNIKEVVKNEYK